MMNAASCKSKLEDLAVELEDRDPDTAANLRDLGEALAGGPTADAWAFANVGTVLNPERITDAVTADGSTDLWARGMEVLRNSLVLLPLAITWFGIALAVDGYYRLVTARPELAGESFIYLWQGGFEGRTPLPLGTLAIIDGVLLAFVFLLTMAAYARSAWVSITNRQFGDDFSHRLSQALIEAELVLAPRRGPQQYTMVGKYEQSARSLVQEITTERRHLDELSQRRERELGDLNGIADQLSTSTNHFLEAAKALATTQSATQTGMDSVASAAQGLAATQQEVMRAVAQVGQCIDGVVLQQKTTSEESSSHMLQLMDTVGTRLDSLLAEQKRGAAELVANLSGLVTEQRRAAERLEQFTDGNKSVADALTNSLGVFSRSSRDLGNLSEILASLSMEQANLVKSYKETTAAQEKVAVAVARANAGFENALTQIDDSSATIRGIAADLTFISQRLPDLMGSIRSDLSSVTEQYRSTAEAVSRANASLERAIGGIEKSLAGLDPLLNATTKSAGELARAVDAFEKKSLSLRR